MQKLKTCLVLLISLLTIACSGSGDDPAAESDGNLTVTLADTGETYMLRDEMKPLGNVLLAEALGDSALLVTDTEPSIGLFENHVMTRTYGRQGRGPCEYLDISNIDTSGDSLFVLDPSQTKIITYRISTGECLDETSHNSLQFRQFLERAGDAFITGRGSYTSRDPDSTVLASRLYDGSMEALSLEKDMINSVPILSTFEIPGLDFGRHGNHLFAAFPFSQTMGVLNVSTGNVSTFLLDNRINREAFEENADDPGIISELMNKGMVELPWRVFASERWVVVYTLQPESESPNTVRLYFYTHAGELISEQIMQEIPNASQGNRFLFVGPTDSTETQYGYQVTYRQVTVE